MAMTSFTNGTAAETINGFWISLICPYSPQTKKAHPKENLPAGRQGYSLVCHPDPHFNQKIHHTYYPLSSN